MRYPEYPESLQALENATLETWRRESLFERTQEATHDGEPWVFYEGPPTANGRPGLHHIISRTLKDLFCRYHTMQGRQVTRIEIHQVFELGLAFRNECRGDVELVVRQVDEAAEFLHVAFEDELVDDQVLEIQPDHFFQ